MMMNEKDLLVLAKEYGFTEARLLPVSLFKETPLEAESLFIAFLPYSWSKKAPFGQAAVSGYYPTSNFGHAQLRKLKEDLLEHGVFAEENKTVFEKEAASYCGGYFGKNTLYFHEKFGSALFIATLFVGVAAENIEIKKAALSHLCENCSLCEKVCPVSALPKRDMKADCMRAKMYKKPMPADAMENLYQLFGCELCQRVCPMNAMVSEKEQYAFSIDTLFLDRKPLEELVGKNYARKINVLQQLIAYAAREKYSGCYDAVRALESEPLLRDVCQYYFSRIL